MQSRPTRCLSITWTLPLSPSLRDDIEVRVGSRKQHLDVAGGLEDAKLIDRCEIGFRVRQLRGGESPLQVDAHRAISTKLSPE